MRFKKLFPTGLLDDVTLPLLSSGGGLTLILSKYLPISARVPLAIAFPLIATAWSRHCCYQSHHFQSGLTLSGFSVPSVLTVLVSDFPLVRVLNSTKPHHLLPLGFHLESLTSGLPRSRTDSNVVKSNRQPTEPIDGKPTPQPSAKLRAWACAGATRRA